METNLVAKWRKTTLHLDDWWCEVEKLFYCMRNSLRLWLYWYIPMFNQSRAPRSKLTIAQLAEHLTVEDSYRYQSVLGSIPSGESQQLWSGNLLSPFISTFKLPNDDLRILRPFLSLSMYLGTYELIVRVDFIIKSLYLWSPGSCSWPIISMMFVRVNFIKSFLIFDPLVRVHDSSWSFSHSGTQRYQSSP